MLGQVYKEKDELANLCISFEVSFSSLKLVSPDNPLSNSSLPNLPSELSLHTTNFLGFYTFRSFKKSQRKLTNPMYLHFAH